MNFFKTYLFTSILSLLPAFNLMAQYSVMQNAVESDNGIPTDCFQITHDLSSQKGAVWFQTPLNLDESFELVCEVNFGCDTLVNGGGDGLAFVLQNLNPNLNPTPNGGGELGYGSLIQGNGITPSLTIQFDTYADDSINYPSINDPLYDHIGLMQNGSIEHGSVNDLGTFPFNPSFTDVENCDSFPNQQIVIKWTVLTNTLSILYCNGIDPATGYSFQIDIVDDIFNGSSQVYWGFTGSTGSATNAQEVCITYFDKTPILSDTTLCYNQELTYDLSYLSNFDFIWKDGNGALISDSAVCVIQTNGTATYQLELTNNCSNVTFTENFIVNVNSPDLLENFSQHTDVQCFGFNTGQFELDFQNAVGPITYTLNDTLVQQSPLFSSLSDGIYEVVAHDSNNCKDSILVGLNLLSSEISMSHSVNQDVEVCVEGGVGPYSLVFNNDTISTANCNLYDLCFGNYIFYVEDALGCIDSLAINVEDIDGYIDQSTSTMIVESAIYPVSFNWFLDGQEVNGQVDSIYLPGLCPGTYSCLVEDYTNCKKSFSIVIDELEANLTKEIDCFDEDFSIIETNITGGTEPYIILWSNGESTTVLENIQPGTYSLSITDNNGCLYSDQTTVPFITDSCLYNTITPNGDGINDVWQINPVFLYPDSEVLIYNRWGKKVFESEGYKTKFEGNKSSGTKLVEGVYFYVIKLNKGLDPIRGSITLFD